jgi:hypothetical protein
MRLLALLWCVLLAVPVAAQRDTLLPRTRVVSVHPVHAALGYYAAEYERVAGESATLGVGAAYFAIGRTDDVIRYAAVDVKARYYPSGEPLRGLSLALTAGPALLKSGDGHPRSLPWRRAVTAGFEVGRSHVLGPDQRLHVGYGAGARRPFFLDDPGVRLLVIPSLRLSVGYAY